MFRYQLKGLTGRYRVIACDQRGHGESDKPAFGNRISWLAEDLHEFLTALDRGDVVALGHSLGCSALWSYWDLFGGDRLRKLILVDQSPLLVDNPDWTRAQREAAGSLASAVDWVADSREIAASEEKLRERIEGMTSSTLDPMVMSWMIDENRKEAACRRIRANVVSA